MSTFEAGKNIRSESVGPRHDGVNSYLRAVAVVADGIACISRPIRGSEVLVIEAGESDDTHLSSPNQFMQSTDWRARPQEKKNLAGHRVYSGIPCGDQAGTGKLQRSATESVELAQSGTCASSPVALGS